MAGGHRGHVGVSLSVSITDVLQQAGKTYNIRTRLKFFIWDAKASPPVAAEFPSLPPGPCQRPEEVVCMTSDHSVAIHSHRALVCCLASKFQS